MSFSIWVVKFAKLAKLKTVLFALFWLSHCFHEIWNIKHFHLNVNLRRDTCFFRMENEHKWNVYSRLRVSLCTCSNRKSQSIILRNDTNKLRVRFVVFTVLAVCCTKFRTAPGISSATRFNPNRPCRMVALFVVVIFYGFILFLF